MLEIEIHELYVPDIEVAARLKLSVEQQKAMQAYFVRRRKCGCYARRLTVNEIMQMDVETNAESTGAAAHQLRRSFLQRWWHLCEILASELTRRRRLLFSLQVVDETVLKKSPWLKSPCEIERSQCYLITTLLSLGAVVNGGGNMALRFAARRGHLYLIELLLMNGADPDAWVPVPSNPLIRWARKSHRIGGGVILSAGQEAAPASPSLNIPQNAIDGIITVDAFMQANLPNDIAGGFGQPQQHHSLLSGHRPLRDILKRKPDLKVSLLLQAVKANHILPGEATDKAAHDYGAYPVSRINMHAALREAFSESKYEMCRVLIEDGGATTTPHMVHELIARASTWRLTIGIREKLTHFLVLAIQHLPEEDFVRMSAIWFGLVPRLDLRQ
ncbi:hypothetical protein BC829DRAFT_440120 [Chytridium lagenaria]|nr:hypothetical protein BC829DRAFT_440120 [Chytridium lagenaria]